MKRHDRCLGYQAVNRWAPYKAVVSYEWRFSLNLSMAGAICNSFAGRCTLR